MKRLICKASTVYVGGGVLFTKGERAGTLSADLRERRSEAV